MLFLVIIASLLSNCLASSFDECTIKLRSFEPSATIIDFQKLRFLISTRVDLDHHVIVNDLGDKGLLDVLSYFETWDRFGIRHFTLVHTLEGKKAMVRVVPRESQFVVNTTEFDGSSSQTTSPGTFSALDGLVEYTVIRTYEEHSIHFVVNGDIFIELILWEVFPTLRPTIHLKQSTIYDIKTPNFPRYRGLCDET